MFYDFRAPNIDTRGVVDIDSNSRQVVNFVRQGARILVVSGTVPYVLTFTSELEDPSGFIRLPANQEFRILTYAGTGFVSVQAAADAEEDGVLTFLVD